jgi:hypothetical protein
MKPFLGLARYYNHPRVPDNDEREFIWAKDEVEATIIMVKTHPNAEDVSVQPFLIIDMI